MSGDEHQAGLERERAARRVYVSFSGSDHSGDVDVEYRAVDSRGYPSHTFVLTIGDVYMSLGRASALALAHALDVAFESARDAG